MFDPINHSGGVAIIEGRIRERKFFHGREAEAHRRAFTRRKLSRNSQQAAAAVHRGYVVSGTREGTRHMAGPAADVQDSNRAVTIARRWQVQGIQKFAPQFRFGACSQFARVVTGAYFEEKSFQGIAEPRPHRLIHHDSMLTNGRRVSRGLCGQAAVATPRCGPKQFLQRAVRGSRANWSRKDREDMAACRRERTTGRDPLPASAARFPPGVLPCPRSTCANPTPAARSYFPGPSRKVLRGSRAAIDARQARSKRPEEWDDDSGRYKCRAAWRRARAFPAR